MQEKQGNTPALSEEKVIDSVGIPKEQVKFNTSVPVPHIITSYSSSSTFLSNPASNIILVSEKCGIEDKIDYAQVSYVAAEIILVSENDGSETNNYGATETAFWDKEGKYPSKAAGWIRDCLTLKSLR